MLLTNKGAGTFVSAFFVQYDYNIQSIIIATINWYFSTSNYHLEYV